MCKMCVLITVCSALHTWCLICPIFGCAEEQQHPLLLAQVESHQYCENNWAHRGWTGDICRPGFLRTLLYRYLQHVMKWSSSALRHPKATRNVARLTGHDHRDLVINTVKFIWVYTQEILWGNERAGPSTSRCSSHHKEPVVATS